VGLPHIKTLETLPAHVVPSEARDLQFLTNRDKPSGAKAHTLDGSIGTAEVTAEKLLNWRLGFEGARLAAAP
jgi:hypothetical protein